MKNITIPIKIQRKEIIITVKTPKRATPQAIIMEVIDLVTIMAMPNPKA